MTMLFQPLEGWHCSRQQSVWVMLTGRAAHYLLCTKNYTAATIKVSSPLLGRCSALESLIFLGRRIWVRPAALQPPQWQDPVLCAS